MTRTLTTVASLAFLLGTTALARADELGVTISPLEGAFSQSGQTTGYNGFAFTVNSATTLTGLAEFVGPDPTTSGFCGDASGTFSCLSAAAAANVGLWDITSAIVGAPEIAGLTIVPGVGTTLSPDGLFEEVSVTPTALTVGDTYLVVEGPDLPDDPTLGIAVDYDETNLALDTSISLAGSVSAYEDSCTPSCATNIALGESQQVGDGSPDGDASFGGDVVLQDAATPADEPTSLASLGAGLILLWGITRKRSRRRSVAA